MKVRQHGFTLVELIVVIVILGILAATALPRFINVTNDARIAAVNGIAGGLRSAATLAQAKWQAAGGTGGTVDMVGAAGVTVTAAGFPDNTAGGILAAMGCTGTAPTATCQGVAVSGLLAAAGAGTSDWAPSNAGLCKASYVVDAAGNATVTTVTTC